MHILFISYTKYLGITIRLKIVILLIIVVISILVITILEGNASKNYQFNITTRTITRKGYTVIKFLVYKNTVYNGVQGIIHYIIEYYYVLIVLAPIVIILLIRYIRRKNDIRRVKIAVKMRILNNYDEKMDMPLSEEKNRIEKSNSVFVLAESLLKYSCENILKLFRTLCRSRIKIVLLIERQSIPRINNIIKIIKGNMLEKCVHLKYVGNVKGVDLNIIDIDEIMSILDKSTIKFNKKYDINNIYYTNFANANKNNNKRNRDHISNNIVVYGMKKKHVISKELYNELKKGIDVKELKKRYDDNIYNLLMDMYNDGIIILNDNKIILVE